MPATSALVMDRYIAATDRAIADEAHLDELLSVFAPDAMVQIDVKPFRGERAIREFYTGFIAAHAASKHFWNTTVLPDGRQKTVWACAARLTDGSVITVAGVEHATVDQQGRITNLHNEFTRRPA